MLPLRARFLRLLPRELRELIYVLVLVEPPIWTKRHTAFCPLGDRLGTCPEPPPCLLCETKFRPGERATRVWQCQCARRKGLGLLLANRQIHAEAAPVFWSRSVFCFEHSAPFVVEVGTVLRPAYTAHIQHISIMSPTFWVNDQYWRSREARRESRMWETIFACKNLRTLELPPHSVEFHPAEVANLRARLPHLESLRVVHLQRYDLTQPQLQPPLRAVLTATDRQSIYVKVAQDISIDLTCGDVKNAVRDFRTNFFVHVDYQVKQDFLGHPPPANPWQRTPNSILISTLRDDNSNPAITLRNGNTIIVPFYGLPNSRATRVRQARERRAHEAQLRAAGKLSTREMELSLLLKEARKKKEEQECNKLSKAHSERQGEKEKLRLKQKKAEVKMKAEQETRMQTKVRDAEESKREERKRVRTKV